MKFVISPDGKHIEKVCNLEALHLRRSGWTVARRVKKMLCGEKMQTETGSVHVLIKS